MAPTPRDPEALKEIKVHIPFKLHVKLQSAKLLTGRTMQEVVLEALERYFAELPQARPAAPSS